MHGELTPEDAEIIRRLGWVGSMMRAEFYQRLRRPDAEDYRTMLALLLVDRDLPAVRRSPRVRHAMRADPLAYVKGRVP